MSDDERRRMDGDGLEAGREEERSTADETPPAETEATGGTGDGGDRGGAAGDGPGDSGGGDGDSGDDGDVNWWDGSALARELRGRSSRVTRREGTGRRARVGNGGSTGTDPDEGPAESEPGATPAAGAEAATDEAEGPAEKRVFTLPSAFSEEPEEPAGAEVSEPPSPARAGDGTPSARRERTDRLAEPGGDGPGEGARREGVDAAPATARSAHATSRLRPALRRGATPAAGGASRLGVVGGKRTGKSYLFQSMVYRTYSGIRSGSLAYYLDRDAVQLFSTEQLEEPYQPLNIGEFAENYAAWRRLEFTPAEVWRWYRLRLNYRTGILGRGRGSLEVEFFDAAGESFFQRAMAAENQRLWRSFADAGVMVFCLPLWVAFPGDGLTAEDHQSRDDHLKGFEQVVEHYRALREQLARREPVRSILALTMADDRRGGLETLRRRWIAPYMDRPGPVLRSLRTGAGTARYLANARRISEGLHVELEEAHDPAVSRIASLLDFGGGRPWLMPISAIEGSRLDLLEESPPEDRPVQLPPPVPVHAELPLLVALCEQTNALM